MTHLSSAVSSSGPTAPLYAAPQGLLKIPLDVLKLILRHLDPVSFNMAQSSGKVLRTEEL